MKLQINPTPQMALAVAVTVLTLAAKGSVALPLGVPPVVGEYVTSWSNFLLQLYAVVAPVLIGFSSSQPGPFAPPDSPTDNTGYQNFDSNFVDIADAATQNAIGAVQLSCYSGVVVDTGEMTLQAY